MAHTKQPPENRAFMEMLNVAKEWLQNMEPEDVARRTGIPFDAEKSQFHFTSLGKEICIHYPDYEITPYVNEWHQLVILHYMKLADGTPLTGSWISMGDLKDGLIRGVDFDRRCEAVICSRLDQKQQEDFIKKCGDLGGKAVESNADFTALFDFLPYYPVLLKIWFADEEFPASGKLLLDAGADHYLLIEDAVTVGQMIMESLMGMF